MTAKEAQITINAIKFMLDNEQYSDDVEEALDMAIEALELVTINGDANEIKVTNCNYNDLISRRGVSAWLDNMGYPKLADTIMDEQRFPSAQPEQRYTEEELRVFQHGISLSLLSKRSSQHWQYDEDTATEIKFLERLYEKVAQT